MQKVRRFDDWLTEKLKNPKFKRFYEEESKRMNIAIKIAQTREAAGLTQKELAARMGTTLQVISRLESGNCSYTLKTLEKIASAIGARLEIDFVPLSKPPAAIGSLSDFEKLRDINSSVGTGSG